MKGIAHFSGTAAASFIPAAVQQSAHGAWVLALAGAWQQYAVRFDTPLREIAVRSTRQCRPMVLVAPRGDFILSHFACFQ